MLRKLLGTLLLACAQAASSLEAPMVLALVKAHGAPEAVNRLWRSEHDTRQFLAGIRSGHPDWLSAAEAVVAGADAGASEDLNAAFADALVVNPYALLPWLQKHWWAGSSAVCVFGEDSELPGGVSMYLSRLEASLSKGAPRDLSDLRQHCLRGIEQTRNALPPGAGAQSNSAKTEGNR